jgi:hypothetical protein
MGLDRARAWTGLCRKAQCRTNKIKQWHRGLGQEDLCRSKQTIGIVKDYKVDRIICRTKEAVRIIQDQNLSVFIRIFIVVDKAFTTSYSTRDTAHA